MESPKPVEPVVTDGWYNVLTGMATAARDKRESDRLQYTSMSYEGLTAVYQSSWLAARIVDKPVEEMTREGFDISVKDKEEAGEKLQQYLDDLDLQKVLPQALTWQRLFGGALVLIGFNDGQADLSKPVDKAKLASIDYLNVFDASEARPVTWQDNPAAPDYGQPIMWAIEPTIIGQEQARTDVPREVSAVSGRLSIPALRYVHASRVYAFNGTVINRRHMASAQNPGIQRGWGDGVLARCIKLVRDFEGAWDGAAYQLREFAQSVFMMSNVAQSLLADKGGSGTSYIQNRMRVIDMSRSMIRAVILDKDKESFERKDSAMTGVADTLREFATTVAAASGMPLSILMNAQGGGLGASGAGGNDIRNWYATVRTWQMRDVKPFLTYIIDCIVQCADAKKLGVKLVKDEHTGEQVPQGITIDFRALYQLSDQEQADLYAKLAEGDSKYAALGTITNEDIARARFSGKRMKVQMTVNMEELEAREEQAKELAETTHEVTVTNLKEHGQETPPKPAPVGMPGKPGAGK